MESHGSWRPIALVAFLISMAFGETGFAQLQTGNLYGTVKDEQGAPLPGATLVLTGAGSDQIQVSTEQGQFRFLGLSPGRYSLKAELDQHTPIEHSAVVINVGRNTNLDVVLPSAIGDTLTVTTEAAPLVDNRRISTGSTIVRAELERIPSARDPWTVLASVPGVLTDRINVGGNESGQQSNVVGPGGNADQSVWSVDGMVITDMAALGSSPAYYDFDSFEEMQVTTGGSDSSIATGGVVLNMVTKRGGNEWKGTGRYLVTDKDNQSDLDFDRGALGKAGTHRSGIPPGFGLPSDQTPQTSFKQGNRIVSVKDYGAELGGPVVKDRLWVWGAYGRQKVDLLTIDDVSDFTDLKTSNLKLNAQLSAASSATLFGLNSDKIKIGRNAGPTRPQETTWNQSKFGPDPTAAKIEDTHIFGSSLFVTGLYSKVNGGFQLVPQGGTNVTAFLDADGRWHNTFRLYQTERPQTQVKADASTFFNTGNLSHELKFGAGRREATVTSKTTWGGAGINQDAAAVGLDQNLLAVARDSGFEVEQRFDSVYLQDTLTAGNLTANFGLRYDKQSGTNRGRTVAASPLLPSVLPMVTYGGGDIGFSWSDVTPRLGLTYALGPNRTTLLRASFSRFADQLGAATASVLNPLAGNSFAYFYTTNLGTPDVTTGDIVDLNGDGRIDGDDALAYSGNVDPRSGLTLQSNGVASDLSAQLTDEALLSVEHVLLPEFVIGLNLTYRKLHNLIEADTLVFDNANAYCTACLDSIGRRARRSDYEQVTISQRRIGTDAAGNPVVVPLTTPNGKPYTLSYYRLRSHLSTRNGVFLQNGGREQEYKGAALTFTKRLANRWMLRGNYSYSDWTWSRVPDEDLENPTQLLGGGNREGDAVLTGSGTASGAKAGVYINSKWSYTVNGLYQIAPDRRWGFNVALNAYGHQGYPVPYFQRVTLGDNEQQARLFVQATDRPDSYRLDDIHMLDARLEKELRFRDVSLTLGLDCFNVFNEAYVLQRNHRLQQGTSDDVREITSPRAFRLGARVSLR